MSQLFEASLIPALDGNANPISGAVWQFYRHGTTTPVPVYNAEGNSLGATITADSAGRFPTAYLNDGLRYRARLLTAASGSVIRDVDPLNPQGAEDVEFAVAYGVVADGTTDNTAAMRTFFAACENKTGVLPPGDIKVLLDDGDWLEPTSNWTVIGAGMNRTTIVGGDNDSTPTAIIRGQGLNNVTLRDLGVRWASQTQHPSDSQNYFGGIAMVNCGGLLIDRVRVADCQGPGFLVSEPSGDSRLWDVEVDTVQYQGIFFTTGAGTGNIDYLVELRAPKVSNVKWNLVGSPLGASHTGDKGIYIAGFADSDNSFANPRYFTNVVIDQPTVRNVYDNCICLYVVRNYRIIAPKVKNDSTFIGNPSTNYGILLTVLTNTGATTGGVVDGVARYAFNADTTSDVGESGGHVLAGFSAINCLRGVNAQSTPLIASGIFVELASEAGIALSQTSRTTITGFTARQCGIGVLAGGGASTLTERVNLTGGIIEQCTGVAMDFSSCADITVDDVMMTNNNSGGAAIRVSNDGGAAPVRLHFGDKVRTKTQSSLLTGSNSGSSFHFESQPSPSTVVAAGFQLSGVYRVWTITSSGAVTSDATTAILSGIYVGQRVLIVNGDANNKVIKNAANTRFTAGADKTLATGGAVEMVWTGSIWQET